MTKTGNGEFKGKTTAEIIKLQKDMDDLKIHIRDIEIKVNYIHEKVTSLETRAATYGAVAGFIITIAATAVIKIILP